MAGKSHLQVELFFTPSLVIYALEKKTSQSNQNNLIKLITTLLMLTKNKIFDER